MTFRSLPRRFALFAALGFSALPIFGQTEKPVAEQPAASLPAYKVTGSPTDGFTISYGVKYFLWGPVDGAAFEEVEAGSLPAKAGIKSGDRIMSVNGKVVRAMKRKELQTALFRNDITVVLEVETPGAKSRKVELHWGRDFWEAKPAAR
ncbi:MAG: PDZ domain-containing protein [Verrucomicrobiota bacterium]